MRTMMVGVFLILSAGYAWCSPQQNEQWTPSNMLDVRWVGDVQVSPDGKRTLFVVQEPLVDGDHKTWVYNIYLVTNDDKKSIQMTSGPFSSISPRWSPDGKFIAFRSDRSGHNNIWIMRCDGGEAWRITDVNDVGGFKWSPKGDAIAFTAPAKDASTSSDSKPANTSPQPTNFGVEKDGGYQLWTVAVDDSHKIQKIRQLTSEPYHVSANLYGNSGILGDIDWSPDEEEVAFTHLPNGDFNAWPKADISVVSTKTGVVRILAATGASEMGPMYSPDGSQIAYLASDDPPSWGQDYIVRVVPSKGGKAKDLSPTFSREPVLLGWSASGKDVLVSESRHTSAALYAVPTSGGPVRTIASSGLAGGDGDWFDALNSSRTWLGFVCEGSAVAPEACITKAESFAPSKVSSVNTATSTIPIGKTVVTHWKSTDGADVEGLVTYPVGFEAGKRYPLLVILHGGPVGAFRDTYVASPSTYPVAAFAAHGYAVLRPNVRGSSGYGRDFRYGNVRDWGGHDVDDVLTGVDHTIELGVVDKDRLGIMGWSYGGYLTSLILSKTTRFRAATIGGAASDLRSLSATTDVPDFIPSYLGGNYWEMATSYSERSPVSNVTKIATPLLIEHGENDTRVPVAQAKELFFALNRLHRTVQLMVYPGMGHNPWDLNRTKELADRNLEWFDQHINGKTASITAQQ